LAHLVYLRRRTQSANSGLSSDYRHIPHHAESGNTNSNNGRLIEEGTVRTYRDVDDDDDGDESDSVDPRSSHHSASVNNTGGDGAPHRVEPSGLGGEEVNQWRQ
jgi:hypothetical protein